MQGLLGTMYIGFPLILIWTWRYGLDLPSLNFDDGDGEFEKPDLGFKKTAAGAPAPENSIAVLPFANMSGSEDNEYFSDGLARAALKRAMETSPDNGEVTGRKVSPGKRVNWSHKV
jgi:hypothetical protein